MTDLVWHVAHLRPRTEKKVSAFCLREGIPHTLPLYRSVKRYRGKQLVFFKPLFPNYLFLHIAPPLRTAVLQHQHVANLLEPPDQAGVLERRRVTDVWSYSCTGSPNRGCRGGINSP